jgi:hypothetical protein
MKKYLILLVCMLGFSCKNTQIDSISSFEKIENASITIDEAQANFEQNILQKSKLRQSTYLDSNKEERIPLWSKSDVYSEQDGSISYTSTPLFNTTKSHGFTGFWKFITSKNNKTGELKTGIIEVIEDEKSAKNNKYKFEKNKFDGIILLHDWAEGVIGGYRFKNGKQITTLSELGESKSIKNARKLASCQQITTCFHTVVYTPYGVNYGGAECYGSVICLPEYAPVFSPQQFLNTAAGGSGANPSSNSPIIRDFQLMPNVRPCIGVILSRLISSTNHLSTLNNILSATNESYQVANFFSALYSNNSNYKVVIREGNTGTANGGTSSAVFNSITNKYEVAITLSPTYLNSASDLAIARTIMHETIHAYLEIGRAGGFGPGFQSAFNFIYSPTFIDQNSAQHNLMANNYIAGFEQILGAFITQSGIIIPNNTLNAVGGLTSYINGLCWGGLYLTARYQQLDGLLVSKISYILGNEQTFSSSSSNQKNC